MSAKAQALVAGCIDLRFQEVIHNWLTKNKLSGKHDRVSIAGCVKNRELLMNQIRISTELHSAREIYLFNHQDCGAYKDRGFTNKNMEREVHENDLRNTKAAIKAEFPKLKVRIFFITIDQKINEVK